MERRNRRQEIERRLAPRRLIEAEHHKGRRAHGRGDFLLRHDAVVRPLVRLGLQALGLYGRGLGNALRPVVRAFRLDFPNLPPAFEGFRILHLSDLHLDGVDGLAEAAASLLAGISADLCVLTGDYRYEVAGPCEEVYRRLEIVLSAVRARSGIRAVLGNHDGADMAAELEARDVRMLLNESAVIERDGEAIWVAGVDDPHYYGCDDLPEALREVPPGAFTVLLAHSPEMYEEADRAKIALYLCGHTHAGQVHLPGVGAPLVNARCPREYTSGAWRHGAVRGVTSAGVGCSLLPVRYLCPPEIVVIELSKTAPGALE